jgi:hypothetical protein
MRVTRINVARASKNVTDAPSFAYQLETVFFDDEPKTLHSVLYTNNRMAQETSLDLDRLI